MELKKTSMALGTEVPIQSTTTLTACDENGTDYDPLKERRLAHPTSTLGSFFHLLKSSLGSGLLAMPAAFKHTGVIPGCFVCALVAIIATHCVAILVRTSREVCKQIRTPSLTYTETCEKTFKYGPPRLARYSVFVKHFADSAMAGVCLGGTSVYVLFIASSIKDICDYFAPLNKLQIEVYCAILVLPLVLITQIRHLKFLVPFSALANFCLLVTFVITCYYTFVDLPDISQANLAVSVTRWPLFLSTAIFAMEGINVVMPVENEMAHPEHFLGCPGVLNITMVIVGTLYGVVGLFGYLKYGDKVLGSITLNLPQDEVLALIAKVLVAVAVFFTYCLQMYAPLDIIWTGIQHRFKLKYRNIGQITLRTVSVILTVVLAAAVPDLELLIGLVGAIFFSTLGLLIPIVVETVHKWEKGLGKCNYVLWKNVLLFVFYILVLVSGCYEAVSAIINKINKSNQS